MYANVEAAEYFERAIAASRQLPLRRRPSPWGRTRGTGRRAESDGRLHGVRPTPTIGPATDGRRCGGAGALLLKLARVEGWLDRYTNALRWISRVAYGSSRVSTVQTPTASGPSSSAGTGGSARRAAGTAWPSSGARRPASWRKRWATRRPRRMPSASSTGEDGSRAAGGTGQLGAGSGSLRGGRRSSRPAGRSRHARCLHFKGDSGRQPWRSTGGRKPLHGGLGTR